VNILDLMRDEALFGKTFRRTKLLRSDTWASWRAFLAALFALPMKADARAIFAKHTGRSDTPAEPFREAFLIVGRRGGKSLIAALIAVFLACFRSYDDVLAPGEVGTVMIIAADRRQARVILGYVNAFLSIPLLAPMVVNRLKESIELDNRVRIEIHTSSFKATRGYTLVAAICDEIAFWPTDESASPDVEVLNALRPGLATTNGLLLGISSPYAKRGALYEAFKTHFAKLTDVLVWKATSREMNPTLSQAVVAAAYLRDVASARAEYGGEFRDDVETFISIEVVEARTVSGRFELPFNSALTYSAFCDPSGGRSDSMTLAIAHEKDGVAVLDCLREIQAPFSPSDACSEFAAVMKSYGISEVTGDRYAGEWPVEGFEKHGIRYQSADKSKSDIFLELLPGVMSGQIELLDNKRLSAQLCGLERRTARGGRDSVDHAPGNHDDLANAAAGAIVLALSGAREFQYGWLAYLKGILDGTDKMPWKEKLSPAANQATSLPSSGETRVDGGAAWRKDPPQPACPACKSTLTTMLGDGCVRCQQCAFQFWPNGPPQVPQINRSNISRFRSRGGFQR
jgi:hypothetical protein